jgi:CheY-like chemotaxis protein
MPSDLDPRSETDVPPAPPTSTEQQSTARALDRVRHVEHTGATETMPHAEFLAMLAHELRNPLQSIAMANQLLSAPGRTDPTVGQAHGVLGRQIGHMSRLLDDLLDASRAANGRIVLQPAPVSVRDIVTAAVETSHPYVSGRQQHLQVNLPAEELTVIGDLVRLAQVVSNLLINASQFTEMHGNIAVTAVSNPSAVEITVRDDGAGIPLALQPFIFDMFTQGQRTLERAPGGLGIGLSLVRTIVRLHGGNATVSSPGMGAGSCFTITLPSAPITPAAPPPPGARPVAERKILIIEDNVDANEIMAMLLEVEGHQVTSSFDGIDGLQQAINEQFDIILCDLGLPGLTGFEVVAALKAERQHDAPFIVATTGYSDGVQRDLARAAGFDHYMVKPLDLRALFEIIASARHDA